MNEKAILLKSEGEIPYSTSTKTDKLGGRTITITFKIRNSDPYLSVAIVT